LASDLNPVAVVTMKAAIEYPLKFGPDLQQDIDKWVKWVGDEAEKRLAEFFPSLPGEKVQNYLWAHTVKCPHCESVVPLSPNWWLSKTSNYGGKGLARKVTSDWYAVKPIPNLAEKRVDFELVKGKKGKEITIETQDGEYNPDDFATIGRGVGKCPCCGTVIDDDVIKKNIKGGLVNSQIYAIAYRKGEGKLEFRTSSDQDKNGLQKAAELVDKYHEDSEKRFYIPNELIINDHGQILNYFQSWSGLFNTRQLLTLVTYVEIINEVKGKLRLKCELEKYNAISTYLALVLDRCIDRNCRLSIWHTARSSVERASTQHSLNLSWNYPEINGARGLWDSSADAFSSDYGNLCALFGSLSQSSSIPKFEENCLTFPQIDLASADSLTHLSDCSLNAIVTDPPYYGTIPYADLADFFYVWMKRTLGDVFPELFINEICDRDREAVANPSRFRNMGASPKELANQDYEAKMALAFAEYHRVLRDDGVMVVQFNHQDSGAWDVLAKSLIDSGFEITASWSVSTENPQNLHQAQKNSVSSTVLLVCRKRDPNAGQAWWDDLRPEVANLVEARAPDFEANEINGIDLYLSAFGPALNVFSRNYPILASDGTEVRPEQAFAEARKAIANYRFRKLVQTDTAGFDPLTTWYILAWDAFRAREFPFDEARQLALAVGGFNVGELAKTYKLLDSTSGICKLLSPQQRFKKRAFSLTDSEFSARYLVDGLHAIITLYLEEQSIDAVRRFMKNTGLVSNDMFMRAIEVALRVIPRIGDEKKRIPEEKALADLWLAMDEIKAKVVYHQPELELEGGQQTLNFDANEEEIIL